MATAQLDSPAQAAILPNSSRFYHSLAFWTFLAVAVGVAWRSVRFFLQFPIWGDEAHICLNLLDRDYAGLERAGWLALERAGLTPEYFSVLSALDLSKPGDKATELIALTAARLGRARLIDNLRESEA